MERDRQWQEHDFELLLDGNRKVVLRGYEYRGVLIRYVREMYGGDPPVGTTHHALMRKQGNGVPMRSYVVTIVARDRKVMQHGILYRVKGRTGTTDFIE